MFKEGGWFNRAAPLYNLTVQLHELGEHEGLRAAQVENIAITRGMQHIGEGSSRGCNHAKGFGALYQLCVHPGDGDFKDKISARVVTIPHRIAHALSGDLEEAHDSFNVVVAPTWDQAADDKEVLSVKRSGIAFGRGKIRWLNSGRRRGGGADPLCPFAIYDKLIGADTVAFQTFAVITEQLVLFTESLHDNRSGQSRREPQDAMVNGPDLDQRVNRFQKVGVRQIPRFAKQGADFMIVLDLVELSENVGLKQSVQRGGVESVDYVTHPVVAGIG